MVPYFLTGLPRSRLSWLANFLTTGRSFCYHAALAHCSKVEHLDTMLFSRPDGAELVGDADPLLPLIFGEFLVRYRESRVVCIFRSYEESYAEEVRAIKEERLVMDAGRLERLYRDTANGLQMIWSSVVPALRMWVPYGDLDNVETIRRIWSFCLGDIPFPESRYRMLNVLRVTQMCSKFLKENPEQPFNSMLDDKELCTPR